MLGYSRNAIVVISNVFLEVVGVRMTMSSNDKY